MTPKSIMATMPAALTIAGSDSGGGAGIQADLKAFAALGVFGTSAVTCLTAQNPAGVRGILAAPARMVRLQIEAVLDAFPVAAAKTGMLYSAGIIRAAARALRSARIKLLVVDPVMIATSGARLLELDAVRALCEELMPLALVVTPNLAEAESLLGRPIRGLDGLCDAAMELSRRHEVAFVLKGGHMVGPEMADVLCERGRVRVFRLPRVRTLETHGTGCAFSAALAALLARGFSLADAVLRAKRFVRAALASAPLVGDHRPLGIAAPVRAAAPARQRLMGSGFVRSGGHNHV